MYRVFLGAPSIADLDKDPKSFQWHTISSQSQSTHFKSNKSLHTSRSIIFPSATLEAASRRISLLYENTIFDDKPDEEGYGEETSGDGPVGKPGNALYFVTQLLRPVDIKK